MQQGRIKGIVGRIGTFQIVGHFSPKAMKDLKAVLT